MIVKTTTHSCRTTAACPEAGPARGLAGPDRLVARLPTSLEAGRALDVCPAEALEGGGYCPALGRQLGAEQGVLCRVVLMIAARQEVAVLLTGNLSGLLCSVCVCKCGNGDIDR